MDNITFISAGAGSGKTFRLAETLEQLLTQHPPLQPSGVLGTTFTKLAANELRERVRQRLNERGLSQIANQMDQALLGTVNSVCGQLLERFAFEVGLSTRLTVIEEIEAQQLFSTALEQVLTVDIAQSMNTLADRLGQENWKALIKNIVSMARANDQTLDAIRGSGPASAESVLQLYPSTSTKNLDVELLNVVQAAIKTIQQNILNEDDTTIGTNNYLTTLQQSLPDIRDKSLPWSTWVKLAKDAPTRRSLPAGEAVQSVAGDFAAHPRLHQDIRDFCTQIFSLAADSLAEFQAYKKIRGLIDFTDQEHLLYQALENPNIQGVLADELKLLMVDEFQDTSPLQLALFLRLARLAKKVIWVGDVKQAIYGFRGSDPALMQAILTHVTEQGGQTEILPTSWRSRPELVNYVNAIFVPLLADTLPVERVALQPRVDSTPQTTTAIEYWQLNDKKNENRYLALGQAIQALIASDYSLVDKETQCPRQAHYGDIAVLCRTNDHLEKIAQAFYALHIPVSRSQSGLLTTPEAALVLAAIRYIVDPTDSLATAELICLTQGQPPETWLQNRLHYLAQVEPTQHWGDELELLQKLASQRPRIHYLTPAEVMHQAIQAGDLRRIVLQWQADAVPAKQRLLNIEQLLNFATAYENQCSHNAQTANVTGLLLWLQELANSQEDTQAMDHQANAVELLTQHGAKGLEWPIVILLDLDTEIRKNYWGLKVDANLETLDITQPLADRALCYWLWPFGKQEKGIQVNDHMALSNAGLAAQKSSFEEAKRLLYVSLTRPRDLLIIAMKDTQGEWFQALNAPWMLPEENTSTLIIPESISIPAVFKSLQLKTPLDNSRTTAHAPHWLAYSDPLQPKLPLKLSPSLLMPIEGASILEEVVLGERISLQGTPDMTLLGSALHAVIATQLINSVSQPEDLAAQVLASYQVSDFINASSALLCVQRLQDFLAQHLNVVALHVEYPFDYILPTGQHATGWIDLLIETENGYIIIDHKSNPQARSEWHAVALKYSGQLNLYKEAVEAITAKPVLACWIHYAITGGMLRLGLSNPSTIKTL